MPQDGLVGQRRVFAHHHQPYRFTRFIVWITHRRALEYTGHLGNHLFDLVGVNIEARDQNHVFFAVDDAKVATCIHHPDVTRFKVAVGGHDLGGFVWALPIPRHQLRALDGNFTRLAWGAGAAVVVQNFHIGAGDRHTDGARKFAAVDWV